MSAVYYNNPKPLSVMASKEVPDSGWMHPSLSAFAIHASLGTILHLKSQNSLFRTTGKIFYALAFMTLVRVIQTSYQQADSGKGI